MLNRAVIYCRVSTEIDIQMEGLEQQIQEAKDVVSENGWLLVDEYIDEGRSGTSTKLRKNYNRLVQDLEENKFDIIVVKSIDRLMRSSRDWYLFIDRMLKHQVRLYFYLDHSFYTPDEPLLSGIKAILAEEFSRELSKKANLAHKNRQNNNGKIMLCSRTWGFDHNGSEIIINPKEAEVIRTIFQLAAEGYGGRTIAKHLYNQGVRSRKGTLFNRSTINKIVRNPLYYGTAIMNRRHYDFDKKRSICNPPEEWVIRENAVPQIVERAVWEKANEMMDQHRLENLPVREKLPLDEASDGRAALAGKIICGYCGSPYQRYKRRRKYDYLWKWSCSKYRRMGRYHDDTATWSGKPIVTVNDGCNNIHINDADLQNVLYEISAFLTTNKELLKNRAAKIICEVVGNNRTEMTRSINERLEVIQHKRNALLDRFLDGTISEEVYKRKDLTFKEEATILNKKRASLTADESEENCRSRIKEIERALDTIIDKEVALFFLYQHIKTIMVYTDRMVFHFDLFGSVTVAVNQINYHKREYRIIPDSEE